MSLTARHFWTVIDEIAAERAMSASALARAAGLDATTFNRSKRVDRHGRERWPATQTLVAVLAVAGLTLGDLAARIERVRLETEAPRPSARRKIRLLRIDMP